MTTIEAVRALLAADAAVIALVGTKLFANLAPQGTVAPYVVLRVISDVPENTLNGTSTGRLSAIRLQIDSYAKTYLAAAAVAETVDAVVSALAGADLAAQRLTGRDLFDDAAQLHCLSADFGVFR